MIVIGSKAMLSVFEETESARFNKSDIDVVMSLSQYADFIAKNKKDITSLYPQSKHKYGLVLEKDGKRAKYEIELETQPSSSWLLNNIEDIADGMVYEDDFGNKFKVPLVEILYLTKKSHIYTPIHFDKNVLDYLKLYDVVDHSKLSQYEKYYNMRKDEVKERFDKRSPSLRMTNDEFFNRSKIVVGYIFEHDDIHQAIKHYEKPVYEMMKTDFEQAWCEKDMFNALPHEYKIKCVQEEAYVIALERYIVLGKGNYQNPFVAYKDALARICTTLCSGFFREFALHNYKEIVEQYSSNYIAKFQYALEHGLVRKLDHVTIDDYELAKKRVKQS